MTTKGKPKVVVIVGPTASGKTSLSIKLAKRFNGEVISADSRQVYQGMDLGTGKVTEEEMDGVPHHLLDVADPTEVYTVHDYVRDSRKAIADIVNRGKLPIVAGGTFFYIDTLLGRISTPKVPPNPTLREQLEALDAEELYARLKERDERRALDIDQHNKHRLVRALEIVDALGSVPVEQPDELYNALTIGISIDQKTLHENIRARLLERMSNGMIEEVQTLHKSIVSWKRMDSFGLEYRYVARFLKKEMDKEGMIAELNIKIRQFAKRQMTWLKRDKSIKWFKKGDPEIYTTVEDFLGET